MTSIGTAMMIALALATCVAGCSQAKARTYAAVLAADTARLNEQIEAFTKARRQLDLTRERLAQELEFWTLVTDNATRRRLAEWTALKDDKTFSKRLELYTAIRAHTEAAGTREAAARAAAAKLAAVSAEVKGERSLQLADATKHLALLSRERSVHDRVKFLAGFVKSVQESVEKAEKDAKDAATAAKAKAEAAAKGPDAAATQAVNDAAATTP